MQNKQMLVVLLGFVAMVGVVTPEARGDTETVDGITWTYTVSNGKASVGSGYYSGNGAVPKSTTGAIAIPSQLGLYPVTGISSYAFSGCSGLTSVTMPDSVTSIGSWAFSGCSSLTRVTIPDGVTLIEYGAFEGCTNLSSVTIPAGVTEIDDCAFWGCSSLSSVTIPDGVTCIGDGAFAGCSSALYDTNSIPGVLLVDGWAVGCQSFSGNLDLTGVRGIVASAFFECSGLTSVTIPASVTSIGWGVFAGCSNLTSVTIADGVTCIGEYAFCDCRGLTNVTIPDSVTWFESYAFKNCSCLTNVKIPDGVTFLGDEGVFYGCSNLTSLTIPAGVSYIGYLTFYEAGLITVTILNNEVNIGNEFAHCPRLRLLCVPQSWTGSMDDPGMPEDECRLVRGSPETIDGVQWYYATNGNQSTVVAGPLEGSANIPAVLGGYPVTAIGEEAFSECYVTDVSIPSSVTNIGEAAFLYSGLTSVRIPENVTSIGGGAFYGCTRLKTLYIPASFMGTEMLAWTDVPEECQIVYYEIVDGGAWECVVENGEATVTGVSDAGSELFIPDTLGGCPVTAIGAGAFAGCTNLASLAIGSGVTNVGANAFSGSGLERLYVPVGWEGTEMLAAAGVPAGCQVVTGELVDGVCWQYALTNGEATVTGALDAGTELYIPGTLGGCPVTAIGEEAFAFCTNLASVTIPGGVTTIGVGAFYHCESLTSVTIPGNVASIGESAFSHCSSLTTLTIPEGGASIGESAFEFCSSLASVTILGNVTHSGIVFEECNALKTVTIGEGVTDIEGGLFSCFGGLEAFSVASGNPAYQSVSGLLLTKDGKRLIFGVNGEVVIPDGVTSIGEIAFVNLHGLTSVTIPGSVTNIGDEAFSNCRALATVTMAEGVTNIGNHAFDCCRGLTNVIVPDSVRTIGDGVFYGCNGLTSLTIPENVSSIGDWAFSYCSGLTSLAIPSSVTNIGANAFLRSGLERLYVPAGWEGTDMLTGVGVPEGCQVVYYDGAPATKTTPVAVEYAWLEARAATFLADCGWNCEAAAMAEAANGRPVWECYVADLDPSDPDAEFEIQEDASSMDEDGHLSLSLTVPPGRVGEVRSLDLSNNGSWGVVAVYTNSDPGTATYTYSDDGTGSARFYRMALRMQDREDGE